MECKRSTCPSPASEITSLSRALSYLRFSQLDQSDVFQSQNSELHQSNVAQAGRRRRLSSSDQSLDVSPCDEARVLVINTGGTIGMTYHNNGKKFGQGFLHCICCCPDKVNLTEVTVGE